MDYIRLGKTGLKVSRICLGCMTYGVPERGTHLWTLNEEQSRPLIKQAIDLGINFFDTANVYSDGTSEEILGRALKEFIRREDVVIATKVNGRVRRRSHCASPSGGGTILASVGLIFGRTNRRNVRSGANAAAPHSAPRLSRMLPAWRARWYSSSRRAAQCLRRSFSSGRRKRFQVSEASSCQNCGFVAGPQYERLTRSASRKTAGRSRVQVLDSECNR